MRDQTPEESGRGSGTRSGSTAATRRGQAWSIDYTIGLLLFLVTFLTVLAVLSRTVLVKDDFPDMVRASDALSSQLMADGYPASWRTDDVIAAGILTENEFSSRKAEQLATIAAANYGTSKDLLNIQYDYVVTFTDRNGSLLPLLTWCRIGAGTEQKTIANRTLPAAYFGAGNLNGTLAAGNATLYDASTLTALLNNGRAYDLIVLEQPDLAAVPSPYDAQKAQLLTDAVNHGATLLLVGNVNLTELFGLNITAINGTSNATRTGVNNTLINLTGAATINVTGYALKPSGQQRYVSLATLPAADGRDFAAKFEYGDGDVYYLGGLAGNVTVNETFLARIQASLNQTLHPATATCTGVTIPSSTAKHVVKVRRLVADHGRIIIMTIMIWEAR